MTKKDKELVLDYIENEGFDYYFNHYGGWGLIKDEKFHDVLIKYQNTRKELADYVGFTE